MIATAQRPSPARSPRQVNVTIPEEAIAILRTCRAAMNDGSKLLLIECILPERIDPNDALTRGRFITDINMFLNPGGRERTEVEFRDFLARADSRLVRVMPVPSRPVRRL